MDNIIRADLYHISGMAVTNFAEKLPAIQGDLAQEILKSNYDGSMNFLSRAKADDNLMRVESKDAAQELLEITFG